jgi:hypothetical protein
MDRIKAFFARLATGKQAGRAVQVNREQQTRLIGLLGSADVELRARAAADLGLFPTDEAAEALVKAVKDREAQVRAAAAFSIRAIAGQARVSVTPVMDALQLEPADSAALFPLVGALRALGPGVAAERVVAEKLGWGMSRAKQAKLDRMIALREIAAEMATPDQIKIGPPFDEVFDHLTDDDPDVRLDAKRILAENRYTVRRLWAIHNELMDTEPRRAMLAGRVLGHRLNPSGLPKVKSTVTMHKLGMPIAFASCPCAYCGHENPNVPVPPKGLELPFRGYRDRKGTAFVLPVMCDFCGNWFYIGWKEDPRTFD